MKIILKQSKKLLTFGKNNISETVEERGMQARDGAVLKELIFHRCGPGSTPGPSVACFLSLLLVIVYFSLSS